MGLNRESCSRFRLLTITLLIMGLLSTTISVDVFASSQEVADEPPVSVIGVLGSSEETTKEELKISTEQELRDFAALVNGGNSMKNHKIILEADITFSGEETWVPIGKDAVNPFSGHFDGNGHTISGFIVPEGEKGGLFGYLDGATVEKLIVSSFHAPNSTLGLFFYSSNTTFSLSRGEEKGQIAPFAMSTRGPVRSLWGGVTQDTGWYDPTPTSNFFVIQNANQLAGLSKIMSDPIYATEDFAGDTIQIAAGLYDLGGNAWTPIGSTAKPFKGQFVGGKDVTIRGLSVVAAPNAGLFGCIQTASIANFTLDTPIINGTATAGSVVGLGHFSDISNITVISPTISGLAKTGGIAGEISSIVLANPPDSRISSCLVLSPTLNGHTTGGIIGHSEVRSLSQNTVYGGTITGVSAGGIMGTGLPEQATFSAVDQSLVLGTKFAPSPFNPFGTVAAGIGATTNYVSITDSVVSNVGRSGPLLAFNIATKSTSTGGIRRVFTDSKLADPFVNIGSRNYVINNYWDNLRPADNFPPHSPQESNLSYSTNFLTSNQWTPESSLWLAKDGHYPQIRALAESENTDVNIISALSAVALRSEDPEENYTTGARVLILQTHTANGDLIDWTGYQQSGVEVNTDDSAVIILSTKNNAGVSGLNITASVHTGIITYTKTFENVALIDGTLNEDISHLTALTTVSPGIRIYRKFEDPIVENPDVANLVTLHTKRKDGNYGPAEQAIPIDGTQGLYKISADKKEITFEFELAEGAEYEIRFPEGILHEIGKPKNVSQKLFVEFSTEAYGNPVVQFKEDPLLIYDTQALTHNDLISAVTVFVQEGGSVIPGLAAYTGTLWDPNQPTKSMDDILNSLPNNQNTTVYTLSNPAIISATPKAGTYQMYIMTKNEFGKVNKSILTISIIGAPQWQNGEPKDVVHIQWTANMLAIETAAQQGATAATYEYSPAQGKEIAVPAPVVVNYPGSTQAATKSELKIFNNGPGKIDVRVQAVDKTGKPSATYKDVTVYLDRPLAYTLTPSPVTMSFTTKRQVEERIEFEPRNFVPLNMDYDHGKNDYRTPGTYYVPVTSDSHLVTLCDDANCPSIKEHPRNSVDDMFIVNIVQTPGAEIDSYWGKTTATAESDVYSQNIIRLEPNTYILPSYVPEGMLGQEFGRMEIGFFDNYRWNIYSNTLDENHKWNDIYSLQVHTVSDPAVSSLLETSGSGLQIEFAHTGRLFGTVEFELNLEKARNAYFDLPDNNLGLYLYNENTDSLDLVSDVIVTENGKWASATISEIYPTTYVLKAKGTNETKVPLLERHYMDTMLSKRTIGTSYEIVDPNPTIVNTFNFEPASGTSFYSQPLVKVRPEEETTSKTFAWVSFVAAIVIGGGALALYLKKKNNKEVQ